MTQDIFSNVTQKIELFFFSKFTRRIESFSLRLKELNPFFQIRLQELNPSIKRLKDFVLQFWLNELNFFSYDFKNSTFFFKMTQIIEPL